MLSGCGSSPGVSLDSGLLLQVDGGVATPQGLADLVSIARSGAYSDWPKEAAVHQSAGPHGSGVRTFVNPLLRDSLKSGARTHPAGSIVVKELYSGTKLTGYAVDAKRDDGTWLFFEGFEPALEQGTFFVGTNNGCAGCHVAGVDYVRTPASDLP